MTAPFPLVTSGQQTVSDEPRFQVPEGFPAPASCGDEPKTLMNLDGFIAYLEQTDESEWLLDRVRSEDGSQNCCLGHLIDWWYGKGFEGVISEAWDAFEAIWATDHMIYPVNDGRNPEYPQATPKERVIAYLQDLNSGKAKNTHQLWQEREADEFQDLINEDEAAFERMTLAQKQDYIEFSMSAGEDE